MCSRCRAGNATSPHPGYQVVKMEEKVKAIAGIIVLMLVWLYKIKITDKLVEYLGRKKGKG